MFKYLKLSVITLFLSVCAFAAETDSLFHKQFRQEIGGWIAADATYSILLPDGRTLWLFGDTFIGEVDENNAIVPGSKFIRNSAVIQDGEQLATLFTGSRSNPSDYIPTAHPDSTWYWPDHGVVDNDTLRIFQAKFRHIENGSDGFNFEHAGNDIANFSYPDLEFINTVQVHAHQVNGVLYGDRVLEDSSYLYIYGRGYDNPEVNIPYPHVARCSKGELMFQEWEYYNGSGWSDDPQDTKRINEFQVSQQYSVSTHRGKYILLTQDIWLSPNIWSFTSHTPVGPWEGKKLLYRTPETEQAMFTYNAWAHPQFDRNGEMLISYNTNGDFWSIFDNVELYRPRFIRVPYMIMDYDFWPNGQQLSTGPIRGVEFFPNPVKDLATLLIELSEDNEISIEILDMKGRILRVYPAQYLSRGSHQHELELSELPPGFFLLRVRAGTDIYMIKAVKTIH